MKNKKNSLVIFALFGMILFMPFSAFAQDDFLDREGIPTEEATEETSELIAEPDESTDEVREDDQEVTTEVTEEDILELDSAPVAFGETIPTLTIQVEQIAWNQFRFRPSSRLGVTDAEYIWQLGDGERLEDRIVEYTYNAPGTYQVELGVIDTNGTPQMATVPVHVGFFHLANWRLWILIGLLAIIIILAAIVAGVTDSLVPKVSSAPLPKKQPEPPTGNEPLEALSEETGDLDSLATTGMDTAELSDELALLESLDNTEEAPELESEDPLAALSDLEPESDNETPPIAPLEEPSAEVKLSEPAQKVSKKSAPKKKAASATKKKTTTKKKTAKSTKKKSSSTKKKKTSSKKKTTKKK